MALTNFGALTDEQLTLWQRDTWRAARNMAFINKFVGDSPNSIIQRISTLKKGTKGSRAVITLVHDLEGDGVAGDRQLDGNEEAMKAGDQVIRIDQLRHAVANEGRMAEQASVVSFREHARDKLGYWLAERYDQQAFLTLSGVPYSQRNNGAPRVGSDFPSLEYASDVKAPTANRRLRWNGTTKVLEANASTASLTPTDKPMWEMLVELHAYAKIHRIKGVNESGEAMYHVFMTPQAMAKLKLDPLFMENVRHAQSAGKGNPLFTGNTIQVDGLYLHVYDNTYNTSGASGAVLVPGGGPLHSKWGSTGDVDGCQILLCGAQALGFADIGSPYWDEEGKDYSNRQGIAVGKTAGFLKPQFYSQRDAALEDFSVVSVYVAH